jgi:DNA-binding CsgD family transcriptional regulator
MGLFNHEVYSAEEQAVAAALVAPVAHALRQAVARAGLAAQDAPGVIVLDGEDRVRTYDDRAAELLAGAVSTGALPGAVHILAARARDAGGATSGRTLAGDGAWIELNASALHDGSVAVILCPAPPASLIELRLRAAGLTAREREIALHLLRGESTAMIAAALHLSPWTVQDHLKAIFDKTGVRSRRAFVARWAFEAAAVSA